MPTKILSKIKTELTFNHHLTHLVDTMKGIAAAQYHMMEQKCSAMERQNEALEKFFQAYDFRYSDHPFVKASNPRKLICLVTTDMGFLGGLNLKVIHAAAQQEDQKAEYMVIGEQGGHYVRDLGKYYVPMPGITTDENRFALIDNVILRIVEDVLKKDIGEVILVFPRAISFTVQRIETIRLIPCPLFAKDKPEKSVSQEEFARSVILESSTSQIVEYLTGLWLRKVFIEVFETAKLAEYGARTMHLEDSFQTLSQIEKGLKLNFFKTRREKIDQNLRETFASQIICR